MDREGSCRNKNFIHIIMDQKRKKRESEMACDSHLVSNLLAEEKLFKQYHADFFK